MAAHHQETNTMQDFDGAMAVLEEAHAVAAIGDAFPHYPAGNGSSRPALASPDAGTSDHATPADDCSREPRVNMLKPRRWRLVRVPEHLARRLERLSAEMMAAYQEGRVALPNSMAEAVPMWAVIENALNEQSARRERSRRPRSKQS
jgi:hypothetical protein